MLKLRDLRTVEANFPKTSRLGTKLAQRIEKPADTVFRMLKDGPTWKEWLALDIKSTSPEPFGVGSTRTATTNGLVFEERFTAWEEGRRMAFYIERSNLPLAAFAEDYVVKPIDDTSCELHWYYAIEWGGPLAPFVGPVFAAGFAFNGNRSLAKLAKLAASTNRFD